MLVCSVVLQSKRSTLAATVVETANANDALSPGAVFAIIADDPGTASDTVGGFVGKLMVEAASAAAVVDAGSLRYAAIVEETNAGASPNATVLGPGGGIPAAVAETTTAASVADAVTVAAFKVAVIDGVFVSSTVTATVLGTDIPDSGPATVFD